MTSIASKTERPGFYRADVDGLRALCVLAVILFHAGVKGFSGGYLGVDVFFVISGYLITLLLLSGSERPVRAQLRDFYLRRSRRILPALVVLLIATAFCAYFLYLPSDLERLGRTTLYAATMLGNIGSWIGGGYFDAGGSFSPLEHLWSIGVEEQFYLIYPFVLLLAVRGRRRRLLLVPILGIGSLLLCLWASRFAPVANYYMLPTRAWELLVGAAVALDLVPAVRRRLLAELLVLAGLAAICIAFLTFGPAPSYPNWWAAVPTLATAVFLGIGAQHPTIANRILTWRPLVTIGLMSYSLYLWHAPIFVFFSYYHVAPPSQWHIVVLIALVFLVGALSWYFVEIPLRSRAKLPRDRNFVASIAVATSVVAAVGVSFWRFDGIPDRFDPEVRSMIGVAADFAPDGFPCMTLSSRDIAGGSLCEFGSRDPSSRTAIVWGDSHALALVPAYRTLAQKYDLRILFAGHSSCRPLLQVHSSTSERKELDCEQFNAAMLEAIEKIDPATIVLNAYWAYPNLNLRPNVNVAERAPVNGFSYGLNATLSAVSFRRRILCVVLDPPVLPYPLPYALAMTARKGLDANFLAVTREEAVMQAAPVEAAIRQVSVPFTVRIADPKALLCRNALCAVQSIDGLPLYRDTNHLSITGASLVVSALETCFAPEAVETERSDFKGASPANERPAPEDSIEAQLLRLDASTRATVRKSRGGVDWTPSRDERRVR